MSFKKSIVVLICSQGTATKNKFQMFAAFFSKKNRENLLLRNFSCFVGRIWHFSPKHLKKLRQGCKFFVTFWLL
jgi:hypothetical protein